MPSIRPQSAIRSAIAAALIFPIALPAEAPAPIDGRQISSASAPLKGDDRLLLVLDRFTYGPRPGDLERLRSVGIQAWFDQQLTPQKIDDSALDQRLADYPAMQLPLKELMERYPNQQVIRRMMNGQGDRPGGEAEKAIYADSIARYKERLAKKNDTDAAKSAVNGDESVADSTPLPQNAQTLIALPPDQRFSALCGFNPQQLKALRQSAQPGERLQLVAGFTPQQLEALAAFSGPQGLVAAETVQTKLLRDLYSERQLNEMMVDFWLNHFNVYLRKSQEAPYFIAAYERDAIRPRAMGNFESLLRATAMSPAMLNYLDNASSIGPNSYFAHPVVTYNRRGFAQGPQRPKGSVGLNENYARELMELHTLGVNGGYTQHDVTEVAKVFTGWTVGAPAGPAVFYSRDRNGIPTQAQFDSNKHEPGKKTVLGVTIKEDGEKEGLQVLHILATSPATARFISTKLAVRFVSDDPPAPMLDRMTQTFLSTHGDIRKVLLAMVNSPEFFTTSTYRAKVKTPQDFVLSAVRASGAEVQSAGSLANVISDLGMPVYGLQTPNGYSMKADPWNNTASLVARLNFALALAANRVVGVHTDWSALLNSSLAGAPRPASETQVGLQSPASTEIDPREKERLLEARLLHIDVSDRTRSAILTQITADPAQQQASLQQVAVKDRKRDPLAARAIEDRVGRAPVPDPQSALAAGLLFGSPEFQRR
jgi:uncharacterized protein (DUF1800 family)